jgi:hypothetical protein
MPEHDACALELDVGRSEVDALPAFLVDRQKGDVERAFFQPVGNLARIVGHGEFDRQVEAPRKLPRKIRSDAARRAVAIRDHEEYVGLGRGDNSDTQRPGWRELGLLVGRRCGHDGREQDRATQEQLSMSLA